MDLFSTSLNSQSNEDAVEDVNRFVDKGRAGCLLKALGALYDTEQFADVSLCVEQRDFKCHRAVLAMSSPFFSALLSSDMRERDMARVELKELSAASMALTLEYIYTGAVTFSEETVQNLLSAANLFQLIPLRHGCAEFMTKHVTALNCIGVYFFARAHECHALALKAKELINLKFETLCKEQEFLSLPVDKLVELVKDDALCVAREETVYEACLAWLHCDLEERKTHLLQVMSCIRFANVSSYYFCDQIDAVALFQDCSGMQEILKEVKYYHMLKNRQAEVRLNFLPRQGMAYERGIVIMANPYVEDSCRKFNSMEVLMPKTGQIRHLCKLPLSLYMPGACTTGENQIYLAGGAIRKVNYRGPFVTEGVSPSLFFFDKSFGSWQVKCEMNVGRSQFCLCMLDGFLYALGGQNELHVLDSVERYDPSANTWLTVAPLPKKMRGMAACAYHGKLFVFGGETESDISKAVYRYDPMEDSWLELTPMSSPRALAGCVVFKESIYVIGGNSASSQKWKKEFLPEYCVSDVEVYKPATDTWRLGPELPNALCGAGVVRYGDTIMVVGGEDDRSWMAGLFTLKEEKGREFWVEGQELPTVMSTFACVVANIPKGLLRYKDDL